MPKFLPEAEMTIEDWRVVHAYRNTRALKRRKKLSKPMRARIPGDLECLEAKAAARNIDPAFLKVWREYPTRDANRDLSFALTVGKSEPARTDDLPALTPGELLDRVEQAIRDAMR
jgi:hypothetical protein